MMTSINWFAFAETCLLSNNIKDYHYVSQGKISVESIDDKEDMLFADEAFDILGFTKEEKYNVYKVSRNNNRTSYTAAVSD